MYPKIYYPKYYSELKHKEISLKDVYPSISKPLVPQKNGFQNDLAGENSKTFFGCFILGIFISFFGCMFITLILNIEKQFWANGGRIILFSVAVLIAVLGTLFFHKQTKKSNNIIERDYEIKMSNYKREIENYYKKINDVKDPIFQIQYKKTILLEKAKNSRQNILHSSQILSDFDNKKGISESFFHDFLIKYSDLTIYKSIKFGYFFPDLLVINQKYNIVVDIEIDEPYVFNSKEPIHYDEIDCKRDIFLCENDFLVIRFCEEQIINHPQYCLNVINQTIKEFISFTEIRDLKSSYISEYEMETWSHEKAFTLAYSNSRKNIVEEIKRARAKYL